MRREVGAIILVVLCLLFKLPELTGDSGRSPRVWGGTEVAPRSLPESRAPRLSGPDAIPRIPAEFYSNALIFLSTAPPDSLALLPGIGPVLAERIACAANARNPFTRWEDLLSVKGIGPKKLEVLKRTAVRR